MVELKNHGNSTTMRYIYDFNIDTTYQRIIEVA